RHHLRVPAAPLIFSRTARRFVRRVNTKLRPDRQSPPPLRRKSRSLAKTGDSRTFGRSLNLNLWRLALSSRRIGPHQGLPTRAGAADAELWGARSALRD